MHRCLRWRSGDFLLGYAEPAAFYRAFRRWTGATPQRWRAERLARGMGGDVTVESALGVGTTFSVRLPR